MNMVIENCKRALAQSVIINTRADILAWMMRLYLSLSVIYVQLVVMTQPSTIAYAVVAKTGLLGWCFAAGLVAVALVSLVDLIVNDVMTDDYEFMAAWHHRHITFMAMALGLASMGYLIAKSAGWTPVLIRYGLDASFAAIVAFVDLYARRKRRRSAE